MNFSCMEPAPDTRTEVIEEPTRIPRESLVFGYGAMLPFPAAALGIWFGGTILAAGSLAGLIIWGAAILIFLAGVRRGLSFRTPGGPRLVQLATMLWLYLLGLMALVSQPILALVLLLAGFASLIVLDPAAARRDEAPAYFARLRPPQLSIAVASLMLALLAVA